MKQTEKKEENRKMVLFFHGKTFENNPKNNVRFTIAGLCTENQISMGIAICSKHDHFVKAEGRRIATERAEASLTGKGVINIMLPLRRGEEHDMFIRFCGGFQYLNKRQLVRYFNVSKKE